MYTLDSKGQAKKTRAKQGIRKMSFKSYLIGFMLIVIVFLLIVNGVIGFANRISQQTEQNFADAIRTMQGK